jgi:hypothetical protein
MDIQYPFNLLPEENEIHQFSDIGVEITTEKGTIVF